MEVPTSSAERRSDDDIVDIVETSAEKYELMGAVPVLPLTEREFRRLAELANIGNTLERSG